MQLVLACILTLVRGAVVLPQPLVPRPCFEELFQQQHPACSEVDELLRREWALELTRCHYRAHGRERSHPGCAFPTNCSSIEHADPEVFTIYTVFFTHVTEICMFYEGIVAHDRSLRVLEELRSSNDRALALSQTQHENVALLDDLMQDLRDTTQKTETFLRSSVQEIHAYVRAQTAAQRLDWKDTVWFLLMFYTHWSRRLIHFVAIELLFEMFNPTLRWYGRAFQGALATFEMRRALGAFEPRPRDSAAAHGFWTHFVPM